MISSIRENYFKYEIPVSFTLLLGLTFGSRIFQIPSLIPFTQLSHFYDVSQISSRSNLTDSDGKDIDQLTEKLIVEPGYHIGVQDIYFVLFWILAITFIRAVAIQNVLRPLGRLAGAKSKTKVVRFGEQSWLAVYYIVFWTFGASIMWNSPYRWDLTQLWQGYPHVPYNGTMKFYYLVQLAFWFQQLFSLHMEKPRKDHNAMVLHHFSTIGLMLLSYRFYFVRVGNVVLVCMDFADIFLSTAKCLIYVGWHKTCDVVFSIFVVVWILTRHVGLMRIIYSCVIEARALYADSVLDIQLLEKIQVICVILLSILELLCIYWFWLIIKILIKVLKGKNTEDTRSDDDDDDDDGDDDDVEKED